MGQIHNWTQEALAETTEAERNTTNAEHIIESAREALQVLLNFIVLYTLLKK